MNEIEISVVMPVFNEQSSLRKTIQSILAQEAVNLEFIVVNDGSTDNTGKILEDFASKDKRIVIVSQRNQGITKALINGCDQARGEFIARQDAGDWSLAGRLKTQLRTLRAQPDIVLCSTGTRYFAERGEPLFEASLTEEEANRGLEATSLESIKGPSHHGCTMFRRDSYKQCGGYRANFTVAQDLDLWTRLASLGRHAALSEIYYEAVLRKNAISSKQRKIQEITRRHIFECSQLRKERGDDTSHVGLLKEIIAGSKPEKLDSELEYNYFVGSVLFKQDPNKSRHYFKQILRTKPWHIKALIKLMYSYIG